jgi:uncharacterized protein with FMN-binding domain
MKKSLISFVFIVGFIAYAFYYNNAQQNASAQSATTAVTTTSNTDTGTAGVVVTNPQQTTVATKTTNTTPTPAPVQTPVTVTTPVVVKKTTGQYVDGTYTGSVADAYYGNVQVAATISGGRLTKVTFIQYPNDRSTSRAINQRATPQLAAQAIQAQSANVSGVSGASDTSAAFKQSLASALAQAA